MARIPKRELLIVLIVSLVGILVRSQSTSELVEPKSRRLAGDYGFTGIHQITEIVLFLVGVNRLLLARIRQILNWLFYVALFLIWELLKQQVEEFTGFNASGHVCVYIIPMVLVRQRVMQTRYDDRSVID